MAMSSLGSADRELSPVTNNMTMNGNAQVLNNLVDVLRVVTRQLSDSDTQFDELLKRSKDESELKGRGRPVDWKTLLIEKIFLRFHSDMAYIGLNPFSSTHKVDPELNPFAFLFEKLANVCENNEEEHTLILDSLKALNPSVFTKVVKTCLLLGEGNDCAAIHIFAPASNDYPKQSLWDKCITNTIPCKSHTSSTIFWKNWVKCAMDSIKITEAWKVVSEYWADISTKQNPESLVPATFALLSMLGEAKRRSCSREWGLLETDLHQHVTACMGSCNLDVRDCGLVVAYAIADIYYTTIMHEEGTKQMGDIGSKRHLFKRLKCFYLDELPDLSLLNVSGADAEQVQSIPDRSSIDFTDQSMSVIPFNEIYEILTDKSSQAEPVNFESYALRICVQLLSGVGMDSSIAGSLIRLFAEQHDLSFVIPTLVCTEIAKTQAEQACKTLSEMIFDRNHYTLSRRIKILQLYAGVMEMLAGTKCLTCFQALDDFEPKFVETFMKDSNFRKQCFACIRKYGRKTFTLDVPISSSAQIPPPVTDSTDWQAVRDRRIEAKTRRFASNKFTVGVVMEEKFSSSTGPHIWSTMCTRLMDLKSWRTNDKDLDSHFLVCCLQFLTDLTMCTSHTASAFYLTYAPDVKSLLCLFGEDKCESVRDGMVQLCSILISRPSDTLRLYECLDESSFKILREMLRSELRGMTKEAISSILSRVDYLTLGKANSDLFD